MSRSKVESTDALEALYGDLIENHDGKQAKELLDTITTNMANYFSSDDLHEFVEFCIDEH